MKTSRVLMVAVLVTAWTAAGTAVEPTRRPEVAIKVALPNWKAPNACISVALGIEVLTTRFVHSNQPF